MTQKRKFPVLFPPQPEEELRSWLIRLSNGNGIVPFKFFSLISGHNILTAVVAPSYATLKKVSDVIGIPYSQMAAASFIREMVKSAPNSRSIGNVLISKAFMRLGHRAYCPDCIGGDEAAYHRKSWRFWFNLRCPTHNRFLVRDCPHCGEVVWKGDCHITPHPGINAPPSKVLFRYCRHCGGDLSDYPVNEEEEKSVGGDVRQMADEMSVACRRAFGDLSGEMKYGDVRLRGRYFLRLVMHFTNLLQNDSAWAAPRWELWDKLNVPHSALPLVRNAEAQSPLRMEVFHACRWHGGVRAVAGAGDARRAVAD